VEITIDCWVTSQRLEEGDRLFVQIASTSFPGSTRNLNTLDPQLTASKPRTATSAVYHDASRPSYVLLPVISREGIGKLRW
jgi:predicted acyl esterase